jgi:Flp pilus assembly protein TadG
MNRIARKNQFGPGKKNIRGAVAVEMAILLIPLIVMAVGVAEFGRAIYQYNTLVKAVRDAGRLLSQHAPGSVNYATYIAEARCLAVHGNVNCSGAPLAAGLTTGMVTVASSTTLSSAGTTINLVEVGITGYQFDFVFNPLAFFGNTDTGITFGPIQTTMRQI